MLGETGSFSGGNWVETSIDLGPQLCHYLLRHNVSPLLRVRRSRPSGLRPQRLITMDYSVWFRRHTFAPELETGSLDEPTINVLRGLDEVSSAGGDLIHFANFTNLVAAFPARETALEGPSSLTLCTQHCTYFLLLDAVQSPRGIGPVSVRLQPPDAYERPGISRSRRGSGGIR
ncbi:hypothetical protein DFH07DRAFT_238472 [Mycena maculata]|uniref:Uncharacterized protein n=1 Tax=Mycena maculata TaxID=230809 RepID=A0AAD7JUV3_9AGAR|nr:hypothetical protein DFH07DRAFT_238472 [Mycena maculata]